MAEYNISCNPLRVKNRTWKPCFSSCAMDGFGHYIENSEGVSKTHVTGPGALHEKVLSK